MVLTILGALTLAPPDRLGRGHVVALLGCLSGIWAVDDLILVRKLAEAKYASCWRAHGPQKATPRISTSARRGQGFSVLLRTWQGPGFVTSVKKTSVPQLLHRTTLKPTLRPWRTFLVLWTLRR